MQTKAEAVPQCQTLAPQHARSATRTVLFLPRTCDLPLRSAGKLTPRPIDLSNATKLKNIAFQYRTLNNEWVAMTLETITPRPMP